MRLWFLSSRRDSIAPFQASSPLRLAWVFPAPNRRILKDSQRAYTLPCDSFSIDSSSLPCGFLYKGGVPAAPSDTATLLRLHPSYRLHLRQLPPYGWVTDFGHIQLPWCDGRCVQDPGTYSPRHSDSRLLAIPALCSRVADYSPNWDVIFGICSISQSRFPLFTPL